MRRITAIALAAFIVGSWGVAHAQSVKDNLPEGNPVFEGEIRPITEPIRLRYRDSLPVESTTQVLFRLSSGRDIELPPSRMISQVAAEGSVLNVDLPSQEAGVAANVAEASFSIGEGGRQVTGLIHLEAPALAAAGQAITPAMREQINQEANRIHLAFPEVVRAKGDPFAVGMAEALASAITSGSTDSKILKAETLAIGLSELSGREVLIGSVEVLVSQTTQGRQENVALGGFVATDVQNGLVLSMFLRFSGFASGLSTYMRTDARYLSEAAGPRRDL